MLLAKISGNKIVEIIDKQDNVGYEDYVEIPEDLPADADLILYKRDFTLKTEAELKAEGLASWEVNGSYVAVSLEFSERLERDFLLLKIDSLVSNPLRWGDLSVEQRVEVKEYRKLLLDVPQQGEFPYKVVWPIKPEELN